MCDYVWDCTCGMKARKPNAKRWLATHYGTRHHHFRHNYDPRFKVTIRKPKPGEYE